MARFSGRQYKGAMRTYNEVKREEAQERQRKAILAMHPTGKCHCKQEKKDLHATVLNEASE